MQFVDVRRILLDIDLAEHQSRFTRIGQVTRRGHDEAQEVKPVRRPRARAVRTLHFLSQPAALSIRTGNLCSHRPSRKESLSLDHDVAVNAIESRDLIVGEAVRLIRAGGAMWKIALRLEVA